MHFLPSYSPSGLPKDHFPPIIYLNFTRITIMQSPTAFDLQTFSPSVNYITDLSYLGLLKVEGFRAKELLQGQLTCHLDDITSTQTRLGAHCNPQGRIISFFRLFFYRDAYYLQMPKRNIAIALNALNKYARFFKVILSDASNELNRIGCIGDQISSILHTPTNIDEMIEVDNKLIIKCPGERPRFEILGEGSHLQSFWETIRSHHTVITNDAWKYLDIEATIPQIYPESSEKFLPHEINLDKINGISFNKGCYTGQEIIARMEYKGKVKTKLRTASIECDVEPIIGNDIFEESGPAGSIVDFCKTGYNKYECLIISKNLEFLFLDENHKHRLTVKGV